MRLGIAAAGVLLLMVIAAPSWAGQADTRDVTREKLRQVLDTAGQRSDINATFRQSTKEPYNFIGTMPSGFVNVDSLEIVASVTAHETIAFLVFPRYKGGYINVNKVKDRSGTMHALLNFGFSNFLFWGADKDDDIFSGFTVTLESGFPEKAIIIVLRSIRGTDRFVGDLRPFIDGSASATKTDSTVPAGAGTGGGFARPGTATQDVEFLNGRAVVSYDPAKWKETASTDAGRRNFSHASGDGYASIIYERIEIPVDKLREIALSNARAVASDVRIVEEQRRRVNATDVMLLRMEGTTTGIKFTYLGYYYGSSIGTIQVITWTGQNIFSEYRKDFEEFLNGFRVKSAPSARE